jgi:hypothetical protein
MFLAQGSIYGHSIQAGRLNAFLFLVALIEDEALHNIYCLPGQVPSKVAQINHESSEDHLSHFFWLYSANIEP